MRSLTVCLLILSALALSVVAHEPIVGGKTREVRRDEGLPCYVVVSNEVHDDNKRREISIRMDKHDVSEANFARLHGHFSTMYPGQERLSVNVETAPSGGVYTTVEDWERQAAIAAGQPYKERQPKAWEKNAQGSLRRIGEMEQFSYKTEGGDMSDMKYVLVKGEDPYCHNCKRLEAGRRDSGDTTVSESRIRQEGIPCYFVRESLVMDDRRFIRLFINAEDASELNLLLLLGHFSSQHAQSEPFVIKVYTNLEQEYNLTGAILAKHFVAVIFRDSRNEVIRYRHPHEKVTTVVVHGVDIFPDIDDHRGTEWYRVP